MKIQLVSWKVENLNFNTLESIREENSFTLNVGQVFMESDKQQFSVAFEIDLKDKSFDLDFKMVFAFATEEKITEEFKFSNFPKVNAPAIAFPFVRSYISNFTLQSGFEPIILPSINFVKLAEKS